MPNAEHEFKSVPPLHRGENGARKRRDYSMFANAALVVLTATVATLMLSPSIHKLDLPVAESEVGKVSPLNIRADRDYFIVDEDSTEKAQLDSASQVRAFYIHDMDLGDRVSQRVSEAFDFIRAVTENGIRETGDAGIRIGPRVSAVDGKKAAQQPKKAAKPARVKSKPITNPVQLARLKDSRAEFVKILQAPVDDEEFEALASAGFSRDVEDGLLSLITPLMQEMLVSSKELLAAERNTGITVQRLYAQEQRAEGTIASVGAIKDLEEARKIIDRKADFILADLPRERRAAIASLAKKLMEPNLRFDKAETDRRREEARNRVIPITISLKKGQMIVRDGDKIEKRHLMIFRGMRDATKDHRDIMVSAGIFVFSMLVIVIPYYFARSFVRKFAPRPRDLLFMQMLLIGLLLMGKLFVLMGAAISEQSRFVPMRAFMFVIPFAAGAMMCRFILNSESALVFSIVASLFAGIFLDGNIWYAGYTLIGSIVAAHGVAQATQRTTVLKAGMLTGMANVATALALSMFNTEVIWSEIATSAVFALGNGFLTAMIITAFTPAVEVMFGYVTDIKLLEQANLNHPLLKELIVQAPGTYHHSIVVGSLVETAAEAIGANPLLARVCAYYHDIGKIKKPLYFGENQKDGQNRLDQNTPPMSALIIKAHVKDGMEIAKAHRLGQPIIDVIAQHHGTTLIKYFYMKAKSLAAPGDIVDEQVYRYPGPKPQTREAALVMMADAVEAAAKSVPNLDSVRLRGLVQKIINNFFRDQQLSECDLTLKDLHKIAAAFIMVLEGIYHGRPEYQESAVKGPDEKNKTGQYEQVREGGAKSQPPGSQEGDRGEDDEDFKRLGL